MIFEVTLTHGWLQFFSVAARRAGLSATAELLVLIILQQQHTHEMFENI